MSDQSTGFSDQFMNSNELNDSELQPVGGTLRLYDDDDPSGYVNPAFSESTTDPLPDTDNGSAQNSDKQRENLEVQASENGFGPAVNGHVSVTANGNASDIRLPPPPTKKDIQRQKSEQAETAATITHTDTTVLPVVYDNRSGNDVVIPEQIVITQSDGSREIQTRAIPDRGREMSQPLRKKRLKFLKIFSVVAIVIFFPTGIPACYFAFKSETEFETGIMRGNIDTAVKYSKRAERLIILSGVLALVFGILCFAMIERSMHPERYVNWHPAGIVGHQ